MCDDDWEPNLDDVEEFSADNHCGMMRMWRGQEITYYALPALARAGRLLPDKKVKRILKELHKDGKV